MPCKNICEKYKVSKDRRGSYYAEGSKRCQVCEIYIRWNEYRCPCCKSPLRTKSRSSAS